MVTGEEGRLAGEEDWAGGEGREDEGGRMLQMQLMALSENGALFVPLSFHQHRKFWHGLEAGLFWHGKFWRVPDSPEYSGTGRIVVF